VEATAVELMSVTDTLLTIRGPKIKDRGISALAQTVDSTR
jgi:hypothetical protein